eukprot:GFUD01021018.1.p1 GENE.GFUD01021018.1~~GFUD01021018.1.p1  ORF type:complete len:526 (+),score=112.14 GFUD01021018.1:119-1579(+)
MDEDALKHFFEEFGSVHQLNVLRDKTTGVSRGCCFVTFYKRKHALDAQNALHNIKTMTGMHHPIQMKPADTENRNERKLFIGMVCKKLTEEDIKAMFLQFGAIEECTVLRDDNGISRGCAFVTFSNRQVAIVAIKAMHHSLTMEGCSSPLVVKFADTQKEKEHKKVQQVQTNLWSLASINSNGLNGLSPGYLQTGQGQSPSSNCMGGLLGSPLTVGAPQLTSQLSQLNNNTLLSLQQLLMGQQQQQLLGTPSLSAYTPPMGVGQQLLPHQDTTNAASHGNQNFANYDLAQYRALSYLQPGYLTGSLQSPLSSHPYLSLGQSTSPLTTSTTSHHLNDSLSTTNCLPYMQTQLPSIPSLPTQVSSISSHQSSNTGTNSGAVFTGGKMKTPDGSYKPSSGPDGANLFIYHLPQEFSDSDLTQTFQPFGTIVSAKVFIDKQTNLSKCFGFVSYTTNESAHAAIQAMNGFQIGTKRLKVQLKRPKDASKPY